MAEREFRLPGSPYEELANIIVAYGTREDAARSGDVGKLDSVHQSSVSRNNAFLVEIGVLQGESKKSVTRRGRELAGALARKDRAGIRNNWRAIAAASEFLQNVVSAVKLREGMLYPTVQAYIAHAAGQPRNKPVMNGAGAIVEILKAAGMLREEAGELVATFDGQPEDIAPENGSPAKTPPAGRSEISATITDATGTDAGMRPAVSIHVQVRCTADEIEDLAPRLKALVRELSTED
jgi:HAMP domain-containing protein